MSRTVYYTAVTLDGYLATEDHSLAWLLSRHQDADHPMSYERFITGIGAIAMGANTYRWVRDNHDGPWPYDVPTWVCTHRAFEQPDGADIRFGQGPVTDLHQQMSDAAGEQDLWVVGGGGLAGQFAEAGLLDEVQVFIAPVTIGAGAPLLPRHVELRLEDVSRNSEFISARYTVIR